MRLNQISDINASLEKTKKAVVALGCSFVEGQGAIDQCLLEEYKWIPPRLGEAMEPRFENKKTKRSFKQYMTQYTNPDGSYDYARMELKNSFVSVLCNDLLNGSYTPINFGTRGCGNRATISNLFLWPEIRWDLAEEIIVVWFPSGPERFDFIKDNLYGNRKFVSMWPNPSLEGSVTKARLWKSYYESLYSNKFVYLESIVHANNLINWCKVHNADLVVYPAFCNYNRKIFEDAIYTTINRSQDTKIIDEKHVPLPPSLEEHLGKTIDSWPWDCMWHPEDTGNWAELVLS